MAETDSVDPGTELVDILLVEDNPYDVKMTLRALTKQVANRIHVVRDGAEALDFLFATNTYSTRDVANPPVLVLLDIKLPKIDGLEVLRRIRSDPRTAAQPVVLLTSSAEGRDIADAYQHHANSYIVKPVDFDQFTNAVHDVGRYWVLHNRSPNGRIAVLAADNG
jgi:two-component system response regulator